MLRKTTVSIALALAVAIALAIAPACVGSTSSGPGSPGTPGTPSDPNNPDVPVVVAGTHPSFLLDPTTLAGLVARAQAGDAGWTRLKALCDQYLPGSVRAPDGTGGSATPLIPTGNNYQGDDYSRYAQVYGLCYQVAKGLGQASLAAQYGAKLVAIGAAISDPAKQHESGTFAGGSFQTQDNGYAIRNYPMAALYTLDWGFDLLTAEQRGRLVNEIASFIDTWDRGWAYPIVSGGAVTGAKLWYSPRFSSAPTCAVTGGGGSGATCSAALDANGYVGAVTITAPGSGYTGTPWFTFNGNSAVPYGGGGRPFSPGTFDSNYYAPYYTVKGASAAVLSGIGLDAFDAYWTDWSTRVHGGMVKPWYAAYRRGGGWPEGYQSYGGNGTRNMILPIFPAKDVKGVNLVTDGYAFPVEAPDYLIHSTWPSQDWFYDAGHSYSSGAGNAPAGYAQPTLYRMLYGMGKRLGYTHAPQLHTFAKEVARKSGARWGTGYNFAGSSAVDDFLWWNDADPDGVYSSLQPSYLVQGATQGAGLVFARSDWSPAATWLSFCGGAYLDNTGQSEEKLGKGGVQAVRGGTPLVVLPENWVPAFDGSPGENAMYNDTFNSPRRRSFYNIWQGRPIGHTWDANQWVNRPPGVGTAEGGSSKARIAAFEEGDTYVLATSRYLEDQYTQWESGSHGHCPYASWSRQVLFLRPNRTLVYDRTATCYYSAQTAVDQLLAWHVPGTPALTAQNPAVAGTTRYDVTHEAWNVARTSSVSTYAGAVVSLLPASAAVTASHDLTGYTSANVSRISIRPPGCTDTGCSADPGASLRWLTLLDTSASAGAVANASTLAVTGGMVGAHLRGSGGGDMVALFNSGAVGTTVSGTVGYTIPTGATTTHFLTELAASQKYAVTATGGTVSVTQSGAGSYTSSANGVLTFTTNAAGALQ